MIVPVVVELNVIVVVPRLAVTAAVPLEPVNVGPLPYSNRSPLQVEVELDWRVRLPVPTYQLAWPVVPVLP